MAGQERGRLWKLTKYFAESAWWKRKVYHKAHHTHPILSIATLITQCANRSKHTSAAVPRSFVALSTSSSKEGKAISLMALKSPRDTLEPHGVCEGAYFVGFSSKLGKHSLRVLLCLFVACSVRLKRELGQRYGPKRNLADRGQL